MRGGVHRYAAQASPQIDTARTEKDRFRMETVAIHPNCPHFNQDFPDTPNQESRPHLKKESDKDGL